MVPMVSIPPSIDGIDDPSNPGESRIAGVPELWPVEPFGSFAFELLAPTTPPALHDMVAVACRQLQQFLRPNRGWEDDVSPPAGLQRTLVDPMCIHGATLGSLGPSGWLS